ILNQLAKHKTQVSSLSMNESVVHEILALANEKQSLKNEIINLNLNIKELRPFESLSLSVSEISKSNLLETKFAKVRLKSKGYQTLSQKNNLEITVFNETKTHSY